MKILWFGYCASVGTSYRVKRRAFTENRQPSEERQSPPVKGERKGQWAITVNGPWRICFRFRDGNAYDVEIVDYH